MVPDGIANRGLIPAAVVGGETRLFHQTQQPLAQPRVASTRFDER